MCAESTGNTMLRPPGRAKASVPCLMLAWCSALSSEVIWLGLGALHLHSTHSDGRGTVEQVLDRLAAAPGVDVVSITDHDEIGAFDEARRWIDRHPETRIQPLWGCEVTVAGFKHILAYVFQPPYPARPFPTFRPLEETLARIHDSGGRVIIAHPDTFWVGVGLKRLSKVVDRFPAVVGVEAYNPYCRSAEEIRAFAGDHNLAIFAGSDAHFMQHLLKYALAYEGHGTADLERSLLERATDVVVGAPSGSVPAGEVVAQQVQSLVVHPIRKLRRAVARA